MNTKVAKALRREANYKPKQPRSYQAIIGEKVVNHAGRQFKVPWKRIELTPTDARVAYLALKKEYYEP